MCKLDNVPTIIEVGGGDINIDFDLKNQYNGTAYNAEGCTARFSVADYLYRDAALLNYEATLKSDENGILSVASVRIPASDTVDMTGAYIYQVSIKDASGNVEPPIQGKIIFARNIAADFVTGG